jgi:pimeloyl-ACP methyl ester carboxylesterase
MDAPKWFRDAITSAGTSSTVDVDGCAIHYRTWGDRQNPGVLLVHGGAAHTHWWDFVAPLLAEHYFVTALDLSGHGESGWRKDYPREAWAGELIAVSDACGFAGAPVVIGHSMGGLVTIAAASLHGEKLAGAIIVDAPVRRPDPETEERRRPPSEWRPHRIYPDLETALGRFRLLPPQACENDFIVSHVARHSLKQVKVTEDNLQQALDGARVGDTGYTWRFDNRVFLKSSASSMSQYLSSVRCRVALLRGEFSIVVPPETGQYMYELLDRNAPLVTIPQAYHHLLLDQPLAFISAIRALLADWEHSSPRLKPGSSGG